MDVEYPSCEADKEIQTLLLANYSIIYIVSYEENRVIKALQKAIEHPNLCTTMQIWDSARGLLSPIKNDEMAVIEASMDSNRPEWILDYILTQAKDKKRKGKQDQAKISRGPVFVLCDFFRYLNEDSGNLAIERKLRVLGDVLHRVNMHIVVISPELQLPLALKKCVSVIDYPLPGKPQMTTLVDHVKGRRVERKKISEEEASKIDPEKYAQALLGLTIGEAEDALARSIALKDTFDVPTLLELKKQVIRKGQLLEYVPTEEGMDSVGGLLGVKEFIRMRKSAFSEAARKYGLAMPKGLFLLGVQGAGKSLCAKAIANEMQVPLLKMDMGRLLGMYVGDSEHNTRRAIQLAESIAPCVLLIDEFDKAVAHVAKRVVGQLLDWLNDKTAPVFVVAAANSIANMPSALIRKGRFDECFFVDLPTKEERIQIFSIHIKKRGRDPSKYDLDKLAMATDKFSGAEIEATIVDSMSAAFADKEREFTTEDIIRSVQNTKPLAVIAKEELDLLIDFASNRMRPANAPYYRSEGSSLDDRFTTI
jgi:hypothetical protein